jgi:hypothetical protein
MTTTIRHPDGTAGTYTVTNPATWAALQTVKPAKKPRAKADKRNFPQLAGLSTADYVRQYFALNTGRAGKVCAYADHQDRRTLYHPLNEAPATWAPDTVEIETVEA